VPVIVAVINNGRRFVGTFWIWADVTVYVAELTAIDNVEWVLTDENLA